MGDKERKTETEGVSMLNKDPEGGFWCLRLAEAQGFDSLGSTMSEMALSVRMVLAAKY